MSLKKELGLKAPGINRGFFIALEGLDGAGKSTLARHLEAALKDLGLAPRLTREPTDGPFGRRIREMARQGRQGLKPEEELDYFVRDRAEDLAAFGPDLLAGRPVVADRYILSNVAYQSALGLSEETILRANRSFPWPDLTVILDIPVAEGLRRISAGRPEGPDAAFEKADYLEKVKAVFDRRRAPDTLHLDGLASPESLTERLVAELKARNLLLDGPPSIVDSHAHLAMKDFAGDLEEVLARAARTGVTDILNVGLGPENSRRVLEMAEQRPNLHPAVGWHPHEADEFTEAGFRELLDLARRPQVKAFGEMGLDFALMHSGRENQLRVFETLLEAAGDLNLPLVIHSREAFRETEALLRRYAPRLKRGGVIHCFTRDWGEARAYLDLGFHLSLPGVVTFGDQALADAAARIPADRLLVETDAPYLAPAPFRGRRNEPAHLIWHLKTLAGLRGLTITETAALTSANARRLFNI